MEKDGGVEEHRRNGGEVGGKRLGAETQAYGDAATEKGEDDEEW